MKAPSCLWCIWAVAVLGFVLPGQATAADQQWRFGVGVATQNMIDGSTTTNLDDFEGYRPGDEPWNPLGLGWYFNWNWRHGALRDPQSGQTIEYMPLVGGWSPGVHPSLAQIQARIDEAPELFGDYTTWLIGNEIIWDDQRTPEQYAQDYHEFYYGLKAINPTYQVANGSVITSVYYDRPGFTGTPYELLDAIRAAYQTLYGEEWPVDVWNIHPYVWTKPSVEEELADFENQLNTFRDYMASIGQQDKPLIITEYGLLDYHDEDRMIQYLRGSFKILLSKGHPNGMPADEGRWVQRWAWFVNNNHVWYAGGPVQWTHCALYNGDTFDIRPLGVAYAAYSRPEPEPFRHNGEPFFPIGIYHYPGGDDAAHLEELSEAGFNCVRRWIGSLTVQQLDDCQAHGIAVLANAGAWLGNIGTYGAQLEAKVNEIKNHPALLAYETSDEPYWNWFHYGRGYSREDLTAGRDFLNQHDPQHPVWCNFAPYDLTTTAGYNPLTFHGYRQWTSVGNLFGMDRYPVWGTYPSNDLNSVSYCCDRLKAIAGPDTTIYMVLQGVGMLEWDEDPNNDGERPNYTEIRFMGYSSIIHGAKGILYWGQYYIEPDSQLWADLKKFAGELSELHDVLCRGETSGDFSVENDACEAILKVYDGDHYLIVANRTCLTRTNVSISVPGWNAPYAEVLFEGRAVPSTEGSFTDDFQPWDVHVYTDVVPAVQTSPGTLVFQDGRKYPDETTYTGTHDAHLTQERSLYNTGGNSVLEACRYTGSDPTHDRSIVIKFTNLDTSWEAGKELQQAVVTLYYFGTRNDPGGVQKTLTIHKLLHDWGEGTKTGIDGAWAGAGEVCWTKPFGATGGDNPAWNGTLDPAYADPTPLDSVTLGGSEDYGPVTFDVTEAVRDHLNDPNSNFGFVIREEQGSESTEDGTRQFHSHEYILVSARPALTLTFAEAPPTVAIESVQTVADHGAAGELGLVVNLSASTLPADAQLVTTESRDEGIHKLLIDCDGDVTLPDPPDALVESIVGINSGDVTGNVVSVTAAGDVITIELSPLPDEDTYTVTLSSSVIEGDRDFLIRALQGEVNNAGTASQMVDANDLSQVRTVLGADVHAGDNAKYDIVSDGVINALDLSRCRMLFSRAAP